MAGHRSEQALWRCRDWAMVPAMGMAPELRPLGVGETLDVSIKVYLKYFWTFIKIVVFIVVPVGLLNLLIVASTLPDAAIAVDGQLLMPSEDALQRFFAGSAITAILGAIAGLVATGAIFKAIAEAYLGKQPGAGESLGFAARRLHSLLWVTLLFGLAVGIGLLLLIIPGVYLGVAWSVMIPALMLENQLGTKAHRRSYNLVSGRWWPTFGTVFLGWFLIPGIIGAVIGFIMQAAVIANATSPMAVVSLTTLTNIVTNIITTPMQAAVLVVLYFDLRVRKEGFDLQLLAERMGGPEPSTLAPGEVQGPGTPT